MDQSINVLFSNKIKSIRHNLSMSQEEFAELIGLQHQSLAQIETGRRLVSLKTLEKIKNALKIRYTDFFDFDNEAFTNKNKSLKPIISYLNMLDEDGLEYIKNNIKSFAKFNKTKKII